MKIYKNIFSKIVSLENLLEAWDEFKKGKCARSDVQEFEFQLEDNLFQLHRDLINKRYQHGAYTAFYIRDPKIRLIHKAEIRDRIVHHAVFKIINPIFEPTFISDSYSSRINKGTHRGVRRLEVFARKIYQTYGRCLVLKCDIKKFFHMLNHKILLNIINRRIKDPDAMWLFQEIIASFSSDFSTPGEAKGAPIGNLTSQLFANVYMNEFDQFIKHKLKIAYYFRYTDDFAIVHQDKNYLMAIKNVIDDFLKSKLKLSLHPHKVIFSKYRQGVDFLGYVALPKARVLRTKTRHRIFKKLEKQTLYFKKGAISEESLLQSFNSCLGVLSHANSFKLKQELHQKFWHWLKEPLKDYRRN